MRLRAGSVVVVAGVLATLAFGAGGATSASGAGLRFHTEVVKDPMSNGIEAFRMLIPNGWVRRGGVVWNLRYSNVASVAMTVADARSHQELQVFPLIPQVWDPSRYLGPVGGELPRHGGAAAGRRDRADRAADRAGVPRQPAPDRAQGGAAAEGRRRADREGQGPGHLQHLRRGPRPHRLHRRTAARWRRTSTPSSPTPPRRACPARRCGSRRSSTRSRRRAGSWTARPACCRRWSRRCGRA